MDAGWTSKLDGSALEELDYTNNKPDHPVLGALFFLGQGKVQPARYVQSLGLVG